MSYEGCITDGEGSGNYMYDVLDRNGVDRGWFCELGRLFGFYNSIMAVDCAGCLLVGTIQHSTPRPWYTKCKCMS